MASPDEDKYGSDPIFALDLTANPVVTFGVEFDAAIDMDTDITESQNMEIFGQQYTFDVVSSATGDLTLYGSDVTVTLMQGDPVTVEVEGDEYTMEIIGGTEDSGGVINLRVTGDGTDVVSLSEGESDEVAGLELFVEDIFVNTIGDESISAEIFVGSQKVVIPADAFDATCTAGTFSEEITIGAEDDTDVYACLKTASDLDELEGIYFEMTLTDFQQPDMEDGQEWEYILPGEEWTDPMFGFSLAFDGLTPAGDSGNMVELRRSGDAYVLNFENNDGDEYSVEVYEGAKGGNLDVGNHFAETDFIFDANEDIADGEYFILNSDVGGDPDDMNTYIFEVRDIKGGTDLQVSLKELGSGDTLPTLDDGDEIEDTGVYVNVTAGGLFYLAVDAAATNGTASHNYVIAKGGLKITLGAEDNDDANVAFLEDLDDFDDVLAADTLNVDVDTGDATDYAILESADWATSTATSLADIESEFEYGISEYGTWYVLETDNDGDYLRLYYKEAETDYVVLLNGPDARVISSGTSSGTSYTINEMVVGQIAVYDDEADSLIGKTPLIVVGGPCANTVAMELMGNPEVCSTGFSEGKAKIKFFTSQNALLVAGWEGEDTVAASQVLADYKNKALTGEEVEVISTSMKVNTIV
jgi:hypothetical protein